MGYLFLAAALLAGATKGYCGKTISGRVNSLKGTFFINMLRMLLCIVIGFFIVASNGMTEFAIDTKTLLITALSGISTAIFVVSWIISVRSGAYVMIDVFLTLGVGVTIAFCRIFLAEPIAVNQYIGFALLIVAACIMCSYSNAVKNKFTAKSLLTLILCGFANGLTDFSQKLFVYTSETKNAAVFNFYTYIFAAAILAIFYMIENKIETGGNDGKNPKIMLIVTIMAICLFANSYFKTLAAGFIDSAVLYPLATGGSLILAVMLAAIFFREKITLRCVIGVITCFISLIIINI